MVLSCSDITEDVSSSIDGELDELRQTSVANHIASCSECKLDHDGFKNVSKLLHGENARIQESTPDIWAAMSLKLPTVCECIQEDLSGYLDGELIAPAKEGVAAHLEQCSECLNRFNQLSQVNLLLSKGLVLPDDIEVDIWSQVNARLNDDCTLIRTELSPFIDREVVTLQHRSITHHLTECADCKNEFDSLSQTGEAIRSNYQPEVPADFDLWPQIKSKMNVIPLDGKKSKPRNIHSIRRLTAVAGVAFTSIAASAMIFMYTQTQSTPQVAPVTAEAYLIDQSLGEPTDIAEANVYDRQP